MKLNTDYQEKFQHRHIAPNAADTAQMLKTVGVGSIDELIDQLIFIEKVEEGFRQSESGKVVSNDDVKLMIDKWSK